MQSNYQSFKDIYSQVATFAKDNSATFQSMIKNEINRAYFRAADAHDWAELRRVLTGQTLSATSAHLYLPEYVQQVLMVLDTDNDWVIELARIENLANKGVAEFVDSGTTFHFADLGFSAIFADFSSSAEQINLVSSSTADTSQAVRITGINNNDVTLTETQTVNGTTTVTSTNTYKEIHSLSCDDSRTGIITFSGTTSSTTYARLSPEEKGTRYKKIRFFQPSDTANTLNIIYKKAVKPLKYDQDIPEIPVADYLREMGIAFAYSYDGNEVSAGKHEQMASSILQEAVNISIGGADDVIQARPESPPRRWPGLRIFRPNS